MWILVANGSRARLFEGKRTFSAPGEFEFGSLERLDQWDHEEGRAHNQELEDDRPGRFYDRSGSGKGVGGKSGWEPADEPKTQEAREFARRLCERLEDGLNENAYDALLVAAPPKFLGLIRESTQKGLHGVDMSEITKDLTSCSPHELRERLPEMMS